MHSLSALYTLLLGHIILHSTFANVEKIVFLAPDNIDPSRHILRPEVVALDVISPSAPALHTYLPASFPSPDHPLGTASWLLLDGLEQNKRYELRVCWAATQPTSFSIHTFSAIELLERPDVAKHLTLYSQSRQTIVDRPNIPRSPVLAQAKGSSVLFLRVDAAADYYSTNQTLMQIVAPVKVDLILDPYHFNVLPRSLRWTICYLTVLATFAWLQAAKMSSPSRQANSRQAVSERTSEQRLQARQQLRALYALPLYQLPSELVLNVLQRLDIHDYPSMIVAAMPLFRRCGIVRDMSTSRLRRLLLEPRRGLYASMSTVDDPTNDRHIPPISRQSILHRLAPRNEAFRNLTSVSSRLRGGFERLPAELRNAIFDHLRPVDKTSLVLASFRFSDGDIELLTHEEV